MTTLEHPLFSIITPTSGRLLLLKRNILSILSQTFSDFEQIIVDDAADRETEELVRLFGDERLKYCKHDSPRGAAGGYNTGFNVSKGKFIVVLDDDDEFYPSFLEKVMNHFSSTDKYLGFIWTGFERIRDTEAGEKFIASRVWPREFPTREEGLIEATSIGNGYGVCVRRECFDKTGLYDESLKIGEDTDLLFRLAQSFDFQTIPEVLVKIHQHSNTQLTGINHYAIRLKHKEEILKRYENILTDFPLLYFVHYKSVVDLCYHLKQKSKGRKIMFSLIRKRPLRVLNIPDFILYELTGKDTASLFR
jgi:glycosyltransferase involved in cell wall biosynthesis